MGRATTILSPGNVLHIEGKRRNVSMGAPAVLPTEFNPADYGSSYSWFAARLETGFTDGQEVISLTDRGTTGMPMNASSPTTRPVWKPGTDANAANGKPLFRYSADRLVPTHGAVSTPTVAAIVYRSTSAGYIFGGTSIGASNQSLRPTSTTVMTAYRGATINIANNNGYDASGWQVCVFGLSPASPTMLFFKSGMSQAASPNNYYSAGGTTGASSVGANSMNMGVNNWNGDIAEFVWWRTELTLSQQIAAGKKLADIYGITY